MASPLASELGGSARAGLALAPLAEGSRGWAGRRTIHAAASMMSQVWHSVAQRLREANLRRPGVADSSCRTAPPDGDAAMASPGGAGGYPPFATGCSSVPSRQRVESGHGLAVRPVRLGGVRRGGSQQRERGAGQDAGPAAVRSDGRHRTGYGYGAVAGRRTYWALFMVGADRRFLCPRDRAGTVRTGYSEGFGCRKLAVLEARKLVVPCNPKLVGGFEGPDGTLGELRTRTTRC